MRGRKKKTTGGEREGPKETSEETRVSGKKRENEKNCLFASFLSSICSSPSSPPLSPSISLIFKRKIEITHTDNDGTCDDDNEDRLMIIRFPKTSLCRWLFCCHSMTRVEKRERDSRVSREKDSQIWRIAWQSSSTGKKGDNDHHHGIHVHRDRGRQDRMTMMWQRDTREGITRRHNEKKSTASSGETKRKWLKT